MTILQRAATIVAMSFSIAFMGTSSQGSAHQLAAPVTTSDSAGSSMQRLTPAASDLTDTNIATPAPVPAVLATERAVAADATPFDTLAEAVAAHSGDAADEAVRCLAGAVYFEAKGEPLAGQLAVAEVIINRAESGRFAPDVCGVVKQRGQFSFVRGGQIPVVEPGRTAYRVALAVARVALAEAWASPAAKALYFNTPGNRPSARAIKVAALGNHVFYR